MTIAPENRPLLTVHTHARGKRSPVTCRLKCDDACLHPAPNESANEYFKDIVSSVLSRRAMLGTLAVAAGAVVIGAQGVGAPSAAAATLPEGRFPGTGNGRLAFGADRPAARRRRRRWSSPRATPGSPIIRWGDPILPGAAPSTRTTRRRSSRPSSSATTTTTPTSCRSPGTSTGTRGHAGREPRVHEREHHVPARRRRPAALDAAAPRRARRAHGMSVVEVERRRHGQAVELPRAASYNRRIHHGHAVRARRPGRRLRPAQDRADPHGHAVLGTHEQLRRRHHPVGHRPLRRGELQRLLRGRRDQPAADARYGMAPTRDPRGWEADDPRFDAVATPATENEPNRFGWIVEIDPYDPTPRP